MIEQMDKEYVLHTYARNYVNFKKGINATLFDENDKDYIDFTSGIAVCSVGHGNKRVADKIYEQICNITHISNLYAIEPQAKLAKKLHELSGYDIRTFFQIVVLKQMKVLSRLLENMVKQNLQIKDIKSSH